MQKRGQYLRAIEALALKNGKMAFITGPRQVGKTTLTEQFIPAYSTHSYFNWDDLSFRKRWMSDPQALVPNQVGGKALVVFDELHKAARWKSTLKGIYDLKHRFADILVTGSARLDVFRRGGDSLLGRYFLFHLHPFTVGELESFALHEPDTLSKCLSHPLDERQKTFDRLLEFGGFPDPYLKADLHFKNAWQIMRRQRLVREDLVDLTRVHELALIEAMLALLPERIGSPLSVQSLAEDLSVAHPTVTRWIRWLAQLFYLYTIPPYSRSIARSLKKQGKLYLWDWAEIKDPGIAFENMVAGHLYKACHFWTDTGRGAFELYYLRDKEKREVDFCVVRDRKPWMLIECKLSDATPQTSLVNFARDLNTPLVLQVVQTPGVHEEFTVQKLQRGFVVSAAKFLMLLP